MLPKTLQPDLKYADDIRDSDNNLVLNVCGDVDDPAVKELRDEVIRRYNAYETLRDTLAVVAKLVNEP